MMKVESQELRVESQKRLVALRSNFGPRLWTLDSRLPRGFTLIELMVTMMIIGILAAAVLGVAAVATETAREAKTRGIVSRIHTLLMEQYGTYVNRRVKLRPQVITAINAAAGTTAFKGQLKAEARLYALREMILMEIPDRWSDVLFDLVPGADSATVGSYAVASPLYLDAASSAANNGRTELGSMYLRQFDRITKAKNKITGSTNTAGEIRANQGAECLYMVIMNACGDGESRTLIPESSIGDVDGDGAPEFIDGWGHPIEFLRWAPGFDSDIQNNANELDNPPSGTTSAQAWAVAASSDHDSFDLYRADPNAFRLVPLIYSAGRDEEFGIHTELNIYPVWRSVPFRINSTKPYLEPQFTYSLGAPEYLGTPDGSKTDVDNISNHLISTKPGG